MATKLTEEEQAQIERVLNSDAADQVLAALTKLFVDVKDETFEIFDQDYDSSAESEAAKEGWSVATGGIAQMLLVSKLLKATGVLGNVTSSS